MAPSNNNEQNVDFHMWDKATLLWHKISDNAESLQKIDFFCEILEVECFQK